MPASAAPNSRRTGSRSLCSLQISLTLLRGHTLENIWRGRPCCVCGHFEPKKSAKLELKAQCVKLNRVPFAFDTFSASQLQRNRSICPHVSGYFILRRLKGDSSFPSLKKNQIL